MFDDICRNAFPSFSNTIRHPSYCCCRRVQPYRARMLIKVLTYSQIYTKTIQKCTPMNLSK